MSSAPDLGFVMTLMTDCLSTEQLADVLLKAIPQRELRWFQPPTPPGRPGLLVQPRAPAAMRAEILDPAYSDLFVADTDALEYLEEIRSVVLAENRERDADTLKFVLEEYDTYFAKGPPSVPDFFRPVLVVFKKWHERGGSRDRVGGDVEMRTEHAETSHARPPLEQNVTTLMTHMQSLASEAGAGGGAGEVGEMGEI
jgi:hypothetical protein